MSVNILLISSSKVHGAEYLAHAEEQLRRLFAGRDEILFIPYARPSGVTHEEYTARVRVRFEDMGMRLRGIHEAASPREAVRQATGVFVGGGNTFVLLRTLYETGVFDDLRARVIGGMPYAGASAGTNIAGLTIGTTNDMPIVYPPSFEALGFVPFNINPHYLDPDPHSTHMGETRETRITEFHGFNPQPVLGLREASMLRVAEGKARLEGTAPSRLFVRGREPVEVAPGSDLTYLLRPA